MPAEGVPARVPPAFEPSGKAPRAAGKGLRFWSIRNAGPLSAFYRGFEKVLVALGPLFGKIGFERLEKPVAFVESKVKGALFDCRMCGQCSLSSTGLSCPMNCPKGMRNGPCGGVRANGNCEVYAEMPCVWAKGWEGSAHMPGGRDAIGAVQTPIDHRLKGRSSWLAVARGEKRAPEVKA